jgi:hypothetical protein
MQLKYQYSNMQCLYSWLKKPPVDIIWNDLLHQKNIAPPVSKALLAIAYPKANKP